MAVLSAHHQKKDAGQQLMYTHEDDVDTHPNARPIDEMDSRGRDQYLLSQRTGSDDPVYDKPKPRQ